MHTMCAKCNKSTHLSRINHNSICYGCSGIDDGPYTYNHELDGEKIYPDEKLSKAIEKSILPRKEGEPLHTSSTIIKKGLYYPREIDGEIMNDLLINSEVGIGKTTNTHLDSSFHIEENTETLVSIKQGDMAISEDGSMVLDMSKVIFMNKTEGETTFYFRHSMIVCEDSHRFKTLDDSRPSIIHEIYEEWKERKENE
jgi:ssDNA-binding Zn-finger/Zn-ribbon topoisomerase 1